ncbi:MAG: NeuD/PglB/VioB family sugar acetyltransferase [Candidatus Competibacteraceae bacterium]
MTPLLIMGAGTFAIETLEIAEMAGGFQPLGFVVNLDPPPAGTTLDGLPVFRADDLPFTPTECHLVAGIVSTRRRGFIEIMQARGYRFTAVIHPSAVISRRATIAPGCVVNAGVVVSPNTTIDAHVIVNRGCLIGHDNHIHPFCTLGPGANLAGALEIGEGAYIGVGAVIRDHLTVGAEAVVGAGAVVVKSVPANVMVAGVPASVVKTGVKGL